MAAALLAACDSASPSPSPTPAPTPTPSTAVAPASDPACLAALAPSLAALPPATWAPTGPVAPADRAALEKAVGVSYDPATGTVKSADNEWLARRKLGSAAGCAPGTTPEILAVRTTLCEEVSTGKGYRDPSGGSFTEVKSATCSGALVWVKRSGEVLAKVVGNATGSPGAMPPELTTQEVHDFSGRAMGWASAGLDTELTRGVAAWSPADRALLDGIEAEDRARRLKGLNVRQECVDNPLAKGCM